MRRIQNLPFNYPHIIAREKAYLMPRSGDNANNPNREKKVSTHLSSSPNEDAILSSRKAFLSLPWRDVRAKKEVFRLESYEGFNGNKQLLSLRGVHSLTQQNEPVWPKARSDLNGMSRGGKSSGLTAIGWKRDKKVNETLFVTGVRWRVRKKVSSDLVTGQRCH